MAASIRIEDGLHVLLRRSARARRMILRVPRDGGAPVLTLPSHIPEAEGRAFLESRLDWLRGASGRVPQPQRVQIGTAFPIEGRRLILTPAQTRLARIEGDRLMLPANRPAGPVVQAFVKHLAHQRLGSACDRHAARLGRPFRAIVLRDTRSRWGSCTSDGRIMFSWRLAMAPPEVLDYVAAHEVAHLAHMDHSPRFWAAVEALKPGYGTCRAWLRRHGGDLLIWRFDSV
ncbi:MAG: SprT family zinc-dependent metalloprotease [Paracoccus sp. (in: a-proteobacteria)]|jgi:predicted metal-dependent hydrolase|uniref:M48 family metallopeptidase n=1 Tax=unclassified Paracoccus (in: a-proteobacteria) TaxID=2688777 RepID=UPI000C497347|nr:MULTISPECIES: SprT family zinc-dependent metalloprotease [unclassified Paracoccus (in: a-proteobacteria)]MAN56253.1 zinc metalloprotease [Paracoccus sp. (in: a-proteobacteria)]MBA50186.1 zinc metalloprotease [Paracoccus sp. (in: a-proteobacteria)]|tara:strand:- start:3441 stop:4130 length:690 start_codon:yes stop_codon:yes gene_type:complete